MAALPLDVREGYAFPRCVYSFWGLRPMNPGRSPDEVKGIADGESQTHRTSGGGAAKIKPVRLV